MHKAAYETAHDARVPEGKITSLKQCQMGTPLGNVCRKNS